VAVITHAFARLEADYNTLTPAAQDKFDQVMDLADNTADNGEFVALMLASAALAGLHIPYGGEVRKCGCSCYCGVIFDPSAADAHVIEYGEGYNLGRHQCPWCADQHRETA
jgi:hypothetical protein